PGSCLLTGLPIGAAARTTWEAGLTHARAQGLPASLIVFDVDGFREHAEALGLERADSFLREVAKRLRSALSDAAYLGRVGGDSFAVLLPGVTVEDALGVSEQTRAAVTRRELRLGRGAARREVVCSLSAGIAGLDRDGETLDQLLAQSHAALWRAKTLGGDRTSLPVAERKQLKTTYYEQGQLERLKRLAARVEIKESVLLREALEDLLLKYKSAPPRPV
ncbi:MAG: diguanylate cyclase, partial [Planctomycetes bacterium]|nr:diguanylate cyclase [Planctomycetota bacterium]